MVVYWLSLHSIPLMCLFFTNTTLSCLQQCYSESWDSGSSIPPTLSSLKIIVLAVLGLLPPLQRSCLENPMDRGASWATVHEVAKSQTGLKQLSTHTLLSLCQYPQNHLLGFWLRLHGICRSSWKEQSPSSTCLVLLWSLSPEFYSFPYTDFVHILLHLHLSISFWVILI